MEQTRSIPDSGQTTAPDRLLLGLWKKCKREWKLAFLTAFIVGMLTHAYMFTNNLLTWDSMFSLYAPQEMTGLGRPLLRLFCAVSTDFNLPMVLGTLSVLYLGLAAAALTECFSIRSRAGSILTGAMTAVFPVVAGTFCYLFTADGYMLAFFLSVLSVVLAERAQGTARQCVPWIAAGAAVLAGSLGIYQAYFAVAITLCILKLLLLLLKESSWSVLFRRMGVYLAMGGAGYALYLLLVQVSQRLRGTELLSYNGVDRIGNFVLADVPRGIYTAYRQFFSFVLRSNVLTANGIMTVCLAGLALLGVVVYLYRLCMCSEKRLLRLAVAAVFVALLPVGATIFCVISPDVFIYILLRMPWLLFFVFVVALAEQGRPSVQIVTMVLTAVMAFQFYLVSNVVYFNMNEKYEKSYALCVRLADRIEQTEGYYPWMKTMFIGAEPDYMKYPSSEVTKEVLSGYYPAKSDYFLNSTDKYLEFFAHYLNISLAPVSEEEEEALLLREDVQAMDTFPAESSVQVIDGVMVIKMSE